VADPEVHSRSRRQSGLNGGAVGNGPVRHRRECVRK
jgi:hypothetical protein